MIPGLCFLGEVHVLAIERSGNVVTASVDLGEGLTGSVTATMQQSGRLVCWGSKWATGELGSYLSELDRPELSHLKCIILIAMSDAAHGV